MRCIILLTALGLSACAAPVSAPAICAGLARPVADLRQALEHHPETPDPVGEAGVDVVLGFEAGCPRPAPIP